MRRRLNLIKLFPTLARGQTAGEEGVGESVVGELLGARVEEQLGVQALCNNTEAEDLRENAVDLERRTCLFLAHAGEEEILLMVARALGHFGQAALHLTGLLFRNNAERAAVAATFEYKVARVDDLARIELCTRRVALIGRGDIGIVLRTAITCGQWR